MILIPPAKFSTLSSFHCCCYVEITKRIENDSQTHMWQCTAAQLIFQMMNTLFRKELCSSVIRIHFLSHTWTIDVRLHLHWRQELHSSCHFVTSSTLNTHCDTSEKVALLFEWLSSTEATSSWLSLSPDTQRVKQHNYLW